MRRLRALWRLLRISGHLCHGLLLMALRFSHASEPARHAYVQWWSGKLLRLLSVELQMHGRVLEGPGLLISNHVSWLDIACLHAVCPVPALSRNQMSCAGRFLAG